MAKVLDAIILILYPLLVFLGLLYLGVRYTALLLLILVGRRFIASLLKNRSTSRIVLVQATAMFLIVATAALSGSALALRVAPFAVSLTFIAMFGLSLVGNNTPLIERFARLQRPDLPPDHVTYCRKLTKVWVGILGANSLILLIAALCADDGAWAIIVGPVSYGMLGFTFAAEYMFRKRKFQDFDEKNIVDKMLRPILKKKAVP